MGHQVFQQLAALKLLPARLDRVVDVAYLFAEVTKPYPCQHHRLGYNYNQL